MSGQPWRCQTWPPGVSTYWGLRSPRKAETASGGVPRFAEASRGIAAKRNQSQCGSASTQDGDGLCEFDGDGSGPRGGVDREGDSNGEDGPLDILVSIASKRQMGWRPHSSACCGRFEAIPSKDAYVKIRRLLPVGSTFRSCSIHLRRRGGRSASEMSSASPSP